MSFTQRKPFRDPVTGDALTWGEELSWLMQGIIRRWTFLIVITVVTLIVWIFGSDIQRVWWNFGASYMALLIEGTVGIAMFSQTRRDAVILRHLERMGNLQAEHLDAVQANSELALRLLAHLDSKGSGR